MNTRGPLLLQVLDALVHSKPNMGPIGTIAVGVQTQGHEAWWIATIAQAIQTRFQEEAPADADAFLFMGVEEAESIVRHGSLPNGHRLIKVGGHRKLLSLFVARYLENKRGYQVQTRAKG